MKILAVDDDGIALNLLRECLMQGGYEYVTFMSSPTEVIKTLEGTAIPYDCILLDVEMPEIDGIKLCGEIRKLPRYRNAPILMITKRSDHASIKQAFSNGATDYITKPFEFFEVLSRIKVAEKLVQERQAAIDSYTAIQTSRDRSAHNRIAEAKGQLWRGADAPPESVERESLISLSTLHNYLEQASVSDGCEIDLIAIKVRQISDIFEKTTATEFLSFLELVGNSAIEVLGDNEAFIAHAGNGVFLYASQCGKKFNLPTKEQALADQLSHRSLCVIKNFELKPEVVIGTPLSLTATPKLNFRRAVKAATARMENREGSSNVKMLVSTSV
ncbi:response regulator [Roseovarius sp. S1116L3]|uniref:response regulator n=1 Tax=Roseovarius roseus TaxID=3342636 RepID=UPI0037278BC0